MWGKTFAPFKESEENKMRKKMFDNTIPVNALSQAYGKAIDYHLNGLQTDFIADNFNVTLGSLIKANTTITVGNSSNQLAFYPAHDLQQLNCVMYNQFLNYVLHHVSFKDTPVIGQYAFPDEEEKNFNIFVLGGNEDSMYIIYEDYENDKVIFSQVNELPHVRGAKMEKVDHSPVKKVSDIWAYHHNAFMGFDIFE